MIFEKILLFPSARDGLGRAPGACVGREPAETAWNGKFLLKKCKIAVSPHKNPKIFAARLLYFINFFGENLTLKKAQGGLGENTNYSTSMML